MTCVQCQREIKSVIHVQEKQIPVCSNPECPNFGLLQVGHEIVSEFAEKENNLKDLTK
jgi:hypothetical protein